MDKKKRNGLAVSSPPATQYLTARERVAVGNSDQCSWDAEGDQYSIMGRKYAPHYH